MAMHPERFAQLPLWLCTLRLPLQLVLIAWAGIYARRDQACLAESHVLPSLIVRRSTASIYVGFARFAS